MTRSQAAKKKVLRARIAYYHDRGMKDIEIARRLFKNNKSARVTNLRKAWNIDRTKQKQTLQTQKIERDGQIITLCPPAYATGYWPQKTARLTGY